MARENILEAIGDISRDKGIEREKLVAVIQEAVTQAAKRKFKQFEDIEARINEESGELEVFRYKTVAEEPDDLDNQIPLEEARKLDSLAEPGDEVEYEIDNKELSRVIAQTARQLIFQKIREAERETIYENFKDRVGEVLHGIVSRTERGRTFVSFNQTEAILYRREQIPHERYSNGDHIRVILLDVLNDPKEPSQLVVSRADPDLLIKLFDLEVPEVYDGIVEIVAAAREPGRRAKIAVRSNDPDVDPVGACVGLRGSRVQSIISELRGEKIDIIHYTEDLPTYVANALAPAELSRVKINEEEQEIDAEVDSDQLSLAIGRFGQNVRLASKLVGYKINVMSPQESAPSLEEQIRQTLLASQAQMGITPPETTEETSEETTEETTDATAGDSTEDSTEETTAEAGAQGEGAPADASQQDASTTEITGADETATPAGTESETTDAAPEAGEADVSGDTGTPATETGDVTMAADGSQPGAMEEETQVAEAAETGEADVSGATKKTEDTEAPEADKTPLAGSETVLPPENLNPETVTGETTEENTEDNTEDNTEEKTVASAPETEAGEA